MNFYIGERGVKAPEEGVCCSDSVLKPEFSFQLSSWEGQNKSCCVELLGMSFSAVSSHYHCPQHSPRVLSREVWVIMFSIAKTFQHIHIWRYRVLSMHAYVGIITGSIRCSIFNA